MLAVPFCNYGVSLHFKAWVDLAIAGAGPTDPLLKDQPTVLVTTLGGGYGPGSRARGGTTPPPTWSAPSATSGVRT
ncbi:hypothetical protein AB0910_09430 [Streptomyces sp. NPDC047002]|uniref:hypothetical protein n=1 Tax=Streptomyces sp. NPDC047002 TaxID=3155475 RepID=UPI0034512EF7